MRHISIVLVSTILAIAPTAAPAGAEDATTPATPSPVTPTSACGKAYDVQGKAAAKQLDDFRADPAGVLKANSVGGLQLSADTKALVLADPIGALDALIADAKNGNSSQAAAIGTGIGQAIKLIRPASQLCADEITQKIAGSGLTDLLVGFNQTTNSTIDYLIGPGSAVAGSGIGGAVGGTTNPSTSATRTETSGTTSQANSGETFSFSANGVNLPNNSCTASVSPRRTC